MDEPPNDEPLLGFAMPTRKLTASKLRAALPRLLEKLSRALTDDEELEQMALEMDLAGYTDAHLKKISKLDD